MGTPHSFVNESRCPATVLISVAPAGQDGHSSARTPTKLWLRVTVPPSALSLSRSAPVRAELPTTTLKLSTPTVGGRDGRQLPWRGIIRHGVVPTGLGFAPEKGHSSLNTTTFSRDSTRLLPGRRLSLWSPEDRG